jgi:hypothetical protein
VKEVSRRKEGKESISLAWVEGGSCFHILGKGVHIYDVFYFWGSFS